MKKTFLALVITILCFSAFSQSAFNKLYNNNNLHDRANSVIQTADSNFLVTGVTNNTSNWYILKINMLGDTTWTFEYSTLDSNFFNYGEFSYSLIQLRDENYLVSGMNYDSIEQASTSHLLKLNPQGQILWAKHIDGGFNDRTYDLKEDRDNNLILVGWNYNSTATTSQALLMKVDSSGNLLWKKEYGGSQYEFTRSIDFTIDTLGYIAGGTTYSYGVGEYSMYLMKTDTAGNMLWQKTYGGSMKDYGVNVITTRDGGYLLVGATEVNTDVFSAYVVKTDSSGVFQWDKKYSTGTSGQEFSRVKELADGTYLVAGNTRTYGGSRPKPVGWLMKLNQNGDSLWSKTYEYYQSDSTDHYFYGMDLTNDGGSVMCGMVINNKVASKNDVWLVKTDSAGCEINCGVGMEERAANGNNKIKLYPNPNNGIMQLEYEIATDAKLVLYDAMGREVNTYFLKSGKSNLNISEAALQNGVYFYTILTEKGDIVCTSKIIVIN